MRPPGPPGAVPQLVLRLQVPRSSELPAGVSRCGGWGAGTVMYGSDRHCGLFTPHTEHLVADDQRAVPLSRASLLQLVAGMAQTIMAAPVRVEFDEVRGAQPIMRVQLPDDQQTAVALYAKLFGLPTPAEMAWISPRPRPDSMAFVAENMAADRQTFCGWRVWVHCFLAGEVTA